MATETFASNITAPTITATTGFVGPGLGQITYDAIVAASGGDYTTVGAAIAAGKYRLWVADGTYTETGFIAPSSANITIVGESRTGTILNYTAGTANNYCMEFNNANTNSVTLHLENLTMKTDFAGVAAGVYGTDFVNSTVMNCTFAVVTQNSGTMYFFWTNGDDAVGTDSGMCFENCHFDLRQTTTTGARYGMLVKNNIRVSACTFLVRGADGYGVWLNSGTRPSEIRGCSFMGESGSGIGVRFTPDIPCVLSGNMFSACTKAIFGISTGNHVIADNVITGNASIAITINGGHENIITGNTIILSGDDRCIWINGDVDRSIIANNYLENGGSTALISIHASAADTLITGNHFGGDSVPILDSGTGTQIVGNHGLEDKNIFTQVPVEASTAGVGSPNILTNAESNKVLTNEAATAVAYNTLPTAVAGLTYTAYCQKGTAAIGAASVTSITSVGTLATATMTAHGFATGDYITIAGADQSEYNGTFSITKTGDDTFTYTMLTDPAVDTATGTITAARVAQGIRFTANTGDTIRVGTSVSGTAGNAESVTTGSSLTLVAINATEWVDLSANGTWVVT